MSQFSNDQLRQGAALVKALKAGDESARLALSDFFEEFGMPNRLQRACGPRTTAETITELRREIDPTRFKDETYDEGGVRADTIPPAESLGILYTCVMCHYFGPTRRVWIGSWPLKAWLGE